MIGWKKFFDVIWPGHQQKLDVVISNFQKHSNLLRNEVTVRDIKEAREARLRSSEHFSKTEAFQELQKYLGLKSRVSPSMYDNRLDWLRNRRTSGCATWLFQDEIFCEWLDASKSTIVWLWLQGIPGAGKTYLTAAAIEHTKEQHRALFAFATHANHNSVSAFSILQSLMFQAAEDDKDFQTVLVESQERELGGNTGYVVGLLKTFLGTSGTTYIIIDGLDEMEECERQILLHRLTEISNECKDLRLLISSRSEDDISRRLEEKATTIRVDDRNSGSIQIYVDRRCQDWMASRHFNPATKKELLQFISPLSAKANGKSLLVSNTITIS
jgi:Cdc6-like AAA superfamily ATPase